MKRLPAVSRRTYIISATLFILLALFGYYFFVFMPKKQERLNAQRVRALKQIGQNFQEKYTVYKKNIEFEVGEDTTIQKNLKELSELNIAIKRAMINLRKLESNESLLLTTPDSAFRAVSNFNDTLKSKQKKVKSLITELKATLKQDAVNQNIYLVNEDERDNTSIKLSSTFATDFVSFFSPLMLKSSFDGYIVYRDTALIYQDIPGEVLRVPSHLYTELDKNEAADRRFVRHNLEARRPEKYETPRVYEAGTDVQLGASDYKLFCNDFTISNPDNHTRWTIYGLVAKDHFEAEKKKIPFFGVVFISVGLLLLLFAMPLMKLLFMSSIERLYRRDALLAPLAFILCLAFIVLLLLISGKYYLSDIPKIDTNLKVIAHTVEKQLKQEIKEIHSLAQQFDKHSPSNKPDTNSISIPKLLMEDRNDQTVDLFKKYPYLRLIYWLDNNGKQQFEYSMIAKRHDSKNPDYANREYFTTVHQGGGYSLPLDNNDTTLYFLQSIISWATGEPISVFSQPAYQRKITFDDSVNSVIDSISVLAVSTAMNSLTEPVLPPGYSFSIIDKGGLVLYHTDRQKNLQENYLQEIDHERRIVSAMSSQSEVISDISYYNRDYRARIEPLSNLPWYLITTYDKEYVQSPYQFILSFSMIGIILISIISVIQFWLIALVYYRPSKLKREQFAFEWLWPYQKDKERAGEETQKLGRPVKYAAVFALNIVYAILLIIYNSQEQANISLLQPVATFIYATVFSNAVAFAILKEKKNGKYWVVLAGSVAITLFVLIITINLTISQEVIIRQWVVLLLIAFLFVFVMHTLEDQKVEKKEPVMVSKGLIGRKEINWLKSRLTKLKDSTWISRHSYYCMIFSYIMLSSCLAVWFLCSKAYEQEKLIWEKYSLYQISEGLKKRDAWLKTVNKVNEKEFNLLNEKLSRYNSAKHKALYYSALDVDVLPVVPPNGAENCINNSELKKILYKIRPALTDLTSITNGFVFDNGKNWSSQLYNDSLIVSCNDNPYFSRQQPLVFATMAPKFISVLWLDFLKRNWLPIILLIILLYVTYLLLKFSIIRLFGTRAFEFPQIIQIDDEQMDTERKEAEKQTQKEKQKSINTFKPPQHHKFVISMPFAGTYELYGSLEGNTKMRRVDLSQALEDNTFPTALEDVFKLPQKEVVLEHFSYGIEDPVANQRRLRLLENLLANDKSVTIISKLTPMQITAKYEELIEITQDQRIKEELETRVSRWKDILSSFVKLYYSKLVCSRNRERLPVNSTIKDLIYYEMSINRAYFERMDGTMVKKWGDSPDNIKLSKSLEEIKDPENEDIKEEILLKIQSMAQPFYFSLWNSCAKEERYILYDLAVDGFVNTDDKIVLLKLMEKGLIYYDESFHIMNESFRNFILTNIKPTEALAMEKELRNKGHWSMYSTIILLLIISLMFFVLFAQKSAVNQFIALLAGIAAAIPYLFRIGSALVPSSDRTDR